MTMGMCVWIWLVSLTLHTHVLENAYHKTCVKWQYHFLSFFGISLVINLPRSSFSSTCFFLSKCFYCFLLHNVPRCFFSSPRLRIISGLECFLAATLYGRDFDKEALGIPAELDREILESQNGSRTSREAVFFLCKLQTGLMTTNRVLECVCVFVWSSLSAE